MTKIIDNDALIQKLKDEKVAEQYFWQVVEECKTMDKEEAQQHLVYALKMITHAQGGFGRFLEKIGMSSDPFYSILSRALLKFAVNSTWFKAENN